MDEVPKLPGNRRLLNRSILPFALSLLVITCADDLPVTLEPTVIDEDGKEPASGHSVMSSVTCTVDVEDEALSCRDVPVVDNDSGLQRVTLGGQMLYVWLLSFDPSYDPVAEIFQADVQVANLIPQGLGSPDGITTTGIRVFHHTGPTVTNGTGTVTVANADGIGTFTGSNQPYFEYMRYLPPPTPNVWGTARKTWQWSVPATVTTFEFTAYVEADVRGENGYVEMSPTSQLLAPGGSFTVTGTPRDVVGRPIDGSVVYTSSDPSIATVDPSTGEVTAVGIGVVDIIASTGGVEIEGITRVTIPSPSGFDIRLEYLTAVTAEQQLTFARAAARWEALIAADLPTEHVVHPFFNCGGTVDEYVDDLAIRVILGPIDGPGGYLGGASPCWTRMTNGLPAYGLMFIDTDDLAAMELNGLLEDVVLHEIGHVLGFGTIWRTSGLLADDTGVLSICPEPWTLQDPYFSGPLAQAVFAGLGSGNYVGNTVPVEDQGSGGTRCRHWRESVLFTELMTGFLGASGNPLSELTVKSLADLGYTVVDSGWDAFSCPACTPPAQGIAPVDPYAGGLELVNDVLQLSIYTRDQNGRLIRVQAGSVEAVPIPR